ncbi:tetratricopeptide repeat protein [Parabacteroides chinchillae]|nr:tetratricopeptide repeat protein [Parabacteroides chinchillae]
MKCIISILLLTLLLFSAGCKDETAAKKIIIQAESLYKSDPDSAYALLNTIELPDLLSEKLLARWCMIYGQVADTLGEEMPYTTQLTRALSYYKKHGTRKQQAEIGLYLGRSYVEDKEYEDAMKAYIPALEMALRAKDYNQAGYICSYMGDLYDLKGTYSLGKDKYEEASYYFAKAGNKRSQAFALRDVGCMYAFSDSCMLALNYLLKADTIVRNLNDTAAISAISNGLGNVYGMLGDLELAEKYLMQAIRLDSVDNAPNYLSLASLYREEGNYEKAREYLKKAEIPTLNKYTPIGIYYQYYLVEKADNCPEKALAYLEKHYEVTDSAESIQEKMNIYKVEKEYNHLKISMENMNLRSEKQRLFILVILFVLFSLCSLFIYYIRINQKNRKLNKQQLDLQQKDIILLRLKEDLQFKQKELHKIITNRQTKENSNLELKYKQKQNEIETLTQRIELQQEELLFSSSIGKKILKLSKGVCPGKDKSPLTEKDWQAIFSIVDEIYPSVKDHLSNVNITDSERNYSYLSIFRLDTNGEAILLHINPESVSKRRQRVRRALGIIGQNLDLCTFLKNAQ